MKTILRPLGAAVAACASALLVSSCYYDPAYTSTSIGGGYSSGGYGYGNGYGYGGSGFSTSFFVSTGNPQWGYDPYAQAYYDYRRRAYYDPYLYGYYPVGYRPPILVGCPHPYGYRPGRYCPPPRVVRYNTVPRYHNREASYRASNYDWARQVRKNPAGYNRPVTNRPEEYRPNYGRSSQGNRTYPSQSRNSGSWRGPVENQNFRNPSRPDSRSRQTYSREQPGSPQRMGQTYVNQRSGSTRNSSNNQTTARSSQRGQSSRPQMESSNRSSRSASSTPSRSQRQEETRGGERRQNRDQKESQLRSLGQGRR